jgi:uncharacterized peroxidase-related enzyme
MTRIAPLATEHTDAKTAATLDAVRKKLGRLPNLLATLAHAPAALSGYLQLSETLANGRLTARQRELIAIAVAEVNACEYCLSAHAAIGKGVGLSARDVDQARAGGATDPTEAALIAFSLAVVRARGDVSAAELAAVRAAGVDDGGIIEVVAHVALNVLTNYANRVAGTEVDFPRVALRAAA